MESRPIPRMDFHLFSLSAMATQGVFVPTVVVNSPKGETVQDIGFLLLKQCELMQKISTIATDLLLIEVPKPNGHDCNRVKVLEHNTIILGTTVSVDTTVTKLGV